ncbi:SRPBCC family protein [Sphingosinicella sp. LHD-64]|uniref:SRPBCC family protein n=1 Tax=Sphingosinicella sp. LHD-64 TaxID=3072139 RepID=UPI00280D53BA|nr:SRPBCC family protein [Sphingosinicella sp. LHD-64]MDQ8755780.1 SRPBCC family protein [Sphingosinicella sp. LHD-64]
MSEQIDLVLERTLNAPRDLVWKAWTDPEHLKRWFAPKPYEISEMELDLRPGGIFRLRMVGPDGFDTGHGNPGCVLEVVEGEKLVWTNALSPEYRPAEMGEGCESFPMTAVITFADAGDGKTFYRAVALHRNAADRETHEKMGFQEGWGLCADQLEELAAGLGADA